jgi:hypothetical protein
MDPDSLKDFEERHAQMKNFQQSIASGDLKAGCACTFLACFTIADSFAARLSQLAGTNDEPTTGASSAVTPSKAKSGKAKRR